MGTSERQYAAKLFENKFELESVKNVYWICLEDYLVGLAIVLSFFAIR
jgi:hypothetical protein